ncbi:type II toxin-antitoxin system RelE/ParE family toxin [Rhizobium ruizarguesonis]|uniref:type II toxin-antitoxin system RelE/ParE family toxin n=1 Tax=Rhizobium ruizarguesonis TaxID=2081791 RepID=UPI001030F915|nr:type II toxin-antitoxin system RelE/ParE family toxin [Rhizobium ruizarguesonis]TAZ35461.1 type II toxin-antitoxin system RelE/ParE family toxin [Rhizobium ruizarguesonis]
MTSLPTWTGSSPGRLHDPDRLSRDAANYVRKETDYLRHHSPVAARRFSQAMKEGICFRAFPEVGNYMHGLQIAGNRTLVTGNYLLDYSYDGQQIDVTSIRHGRMVVQTPDIDLEEDLEDENDQDHENDGQKPKRR